MTQRLLLPGDQNSVAYTTTWTGGSPSIGNGTLNARYKMSGRLLHLEIELFAGSTTTFGTTAWEFSLPPGFTPVAALSDQRQAVGSFWALHVGTGYWVGTVTLLGTPTPTNLVMYTNSNGGVSFQQGNPFSWGSTDVLSLYASFEVL